MKINELKNKIKRKNPQIETVIKKDIGFQIGKQIELARAIKNLTQSELATKVGTKQPSIARIESGASLPSLSFLKKIAEAFETYLIPPKFAFMEDLTNQVIVYYSHNSFTESSKSAKTREIESPYYNSMDIRFNSKDSN